jgi:hypothetical protein
MTNMTTNDFNYDTIEYTIGMGSGRFFKCDKVEKFEKRALKKSLYEDIPDDKPVKFYFDCDFKCPIDGMDVGDDLKLIATDVIDLNIKYINALFAVSSTVVPDIRYAESHYEHRMIKGVPYWGISFHIVIQNIMAFKKTIGEFARHLNEFIAKDQLLKTSPIRGENDLYKNFLGDKNYEAVDTKPYSAGRQKMRCIHASKDNEKRPFRLQNGTFEEMVITAFISPYAVIYAPEPEPEPISEISEIPTPKIQTSTKSEYDIIFVKKCFEQGMFFNDAKGDKWKTVGFFLKGYFGDNEIAYTLFDTFSKLCPAQYVEYENKEKWDGFAVDGNKYDSFGIFMNWAKKDNSVLCKQITEEIKILKKDEKASNTKAKLDMKIASAKVKSDSKEAEIKSRADAKKDSKDSSDALFATMSQEFELTHTKIINDSVFVKQLEEKIIIMSEKALITSYKHIQCGVDSTHCPITFIKRWLECNDNINKKDSMQIYPNPDKCPADVFNLWRPFAMEVLTSPYETHTEGLNMMLKHIMVLCNNEKEVFDYFIGWIAMMIQKPEIKTTCITLISKEGAGKGTLMQLFSKMLGESKILETKTPSRDVWGQFNYG